MRDGPKEIVVKSAAEAKKMADDVILEDDSSKLKVKREYRQADKEDVPKFLEQALQDITSAARNGNKDARIALPGIKHHQAVLVAAELYHRGFDVSLCNNENLQILWGP